MLRVSYDTKPFKFPVVSRIRLNVVDSFINEEKILLDEKIKDLLVKGYNRETVKKIYDKTNSQLEKELEKKRMFMIKLRSILSFIREDSVIEFAKEDIDFNFKNIVVL